MVVDTLNSPSTLPHPVKDPTHPVKDPTPPCKRSVLENIN